MVFAWMDKRTDGKNADLYWAVTSGFEVQADSRANDVSEGQQDHPQVAFSPDSKTAYVVWEDNRSGRWQVFGTSTGMKGKNVLLSGAKKGAYPSIATGGDVVAVVYETEKGVGFTLFSTPVERSGR